MNIECLVFTTVGISPSWLHSYSRIKRATLCRTAGRAGECHRTTRFV